MIFMGKVTTKKERIYYYDLLRAIAIICVILCHVDVFFGTFDNDLKIILIPTFHHIALIGVPIFLMISGALVFNKKYDLSQFLKRRFTRIIYPFIFWMLLILIIGYFYFHWDVEHLWRIFVGDPGISWFFWMLIGVYLFIPIIDSFLEKYNLKGFEYFLLIWFITILLESVIQYSLFPNLNLSYFAGFIGFPVLGYYLDNKNFNLSNSQMFLISLMIFIGAWFIYCYSGNNNIDIINPLYLNFPTVFMGIGVFLLIKYADTLNLINNFGFIKKIVVSLSVCSYGMYYSHFIIISLLEQLNIHSFKLLPIVIVVVIFFSWLLPYIFSRIPYLKKFSGV